MTKENLDQHFNNATTPKFDDDLETESIMFDLITPRGDQKISIPQQDKKEETKEEPKVSAKTIGENVINNTATIKSKSLSMSHQGGQESENMRRLQEALHSKKEINNELN